jgi:hypothetical protein
MVNSSLKVEGAHLVGSEFGSGFVPKSVFVTAFFSLVFSLTACGQTAFNVLSNTQNQASPGFFNVPPKVDILLFVDDTGSMTSAYSTIQTQVPQFLNQLEAQKWDYHFASNGLTTPRAQIPQVAGSIYDGSHSGWVAPYPGASQSGVGNIVPNFFRSLSLADQGTPIAVSDFLTPAQVNSSLSGSEPGFKTIWSTLTSAINGTGFLRSDALLVVMVMGNGNDNSDVIYAPRSGDNYLVPTPDSLSTSLNSYETLMNGFCAGGKCQSLQFHAAVSFNGGSCLNSNVPAKQGMRYLQMATATSGGQYDICSQSISSVLSQLGNHLTSTKLAYSTDYLMLSSAPNLSSIGVTKYLSGDTTQPQVIPQSSTNGWTYVGYVTNQTVSFIRGSNGIVTRSNPASGYAIQLHGSAILTGSDTASVDSKPAGAQNSVTH